MIFSRRSMSSVFFAIIHFLLGKRMDHLMVCKSVGSSLLSRLWFSQISFGDRKKKPQFKNFCSITQDIGDTDNCESKFIEIGHIRKTHGIRGEVIVIPDTGFGELRFAMPGKRWLRRNVFGKETIDEVDLVKGRAHVGKKTWIVTFKGYSTIELSQHLIGSTILVREDDRPVLEDGEVYLKDVIGMTVFLKEGGNLVGTVIHVAYAGDSPLLRVRIDSYDILSDKARAAIGDDVFHAWIPLVEPIVPVFDIEKREMYIDPPDGLLEINLPTPRSSKNVWKEKIYFKKKLTAAKKHLLLMGQRHILEVFSVKEKNKGVKFANQIISMNLRLLNLVLQKVDMPNNRWNLSRFLDNNLSKVGKASLRMGIESKYSIFKREKIGLDLIEEAKVAIILVLNRATHSGNEKEPWFSSHCFELFSSDKFLKVEKRKLVPLILVCPTGEIESVQRIFSDNDYFDFDQQKVWFLEEVKLPIVSDDSSHRIFMKLPWEVMECPLGSGGVITLLSSNTTILNTLKNDGIEYVQVCHSGPSSEGVTSLLYGYMIDSKTDVETDVGIEIEKVDENIERVEMVFRIGFLRTVVGRVKDLPFCGTVKTSTHFELVDNEWTHVVPTSPNSLEFSCSLESSLELCPPEKIFVLEIKM